MEQKQRHEQVADIHYGHEERTSSPLFNFFLFCAGMLALILIVIGLVHNWNMLLSVSTGIVESLIVLVCFIVPLLILGGLCYVGFNCTMWILERLDSRYERKEALRRDNERHTLELEIVRRHIPVDERGNAAVLLNGRVTQITGNYAAYPKLTSLHQSHTSEANNGDRLLGSGDTSIPEALPMPIQTFHEILVSGKIQQALHKGEMVLGYENGQLRYGSWLDLYSAGIGGVSGSGKTTTVRFLLFQAVLAHGKLIMIDPHINEPEESLAAQFKVFKNIHVLPPCIDDPSAVVKRVRWLDKEYKRRKARGIKGPPIIFVLDEFNAIVRNLPDELRKELAELLKAIAQEGRKFGLFAMLIGQRWSEQDLGGKNCGAVIRSSLASTLAHRFTDEEQAKKLIGSKHGPKCLELEQGHYYFRDTHGHLTEMITPYTVMEDGAYIQRLLDGENTLESTSYEPETTEQFEFSAIPNERIEPLQIADFKRESTLAPSIQVPESTEIEALARRVVLLQADGKQKAEIMRTVWNANPGATEEYRKAVQEYQQVMKFIAERLGA